MEAVALFAVRRRPAVVGSKISRVALSSKIVPTAIPGVLVGLKPNTPMALPLE